MITEQVIRQQICEIGRRIYDKDFVAANDGNISVKISDQEIITTPTGVSKGYMTPDMLLKVTLDGELAYPPGDYKPTSELKMHLRVYKERKDVKAVVHAHPPYATGFAIAGIPLNKPVMPEAIINLGSVPLAKYGTPSTDEIPESIAPYLPYYDAVLLANHGALTFGCDLINAYHKMESLEFYAKLMFISSQLDEPRELNEFQVQRLYDLRRRMNLPGKHPFVSD